MCEGVHPSKQKQANLYLYELYYSFMTSYVLIK